MKLQLTRWFKKVGGISWVRGWGGFWRKRERGREWRCGLMIRPGILWEKCLCRAEG